MTDEKHKWVLRPRTTESRAKFWKRMEKKLRMDTPTMDERFGLYYWILGLVEIARYINEKDLRKIFHIFYLRALCKLEQDNEIRRNGYGIYYITPYDREMYY